MTARDGLRPVRAWAYLGLLLGMAWQPMRARAAEPPVVEPADADLIEFLGSVDSDDAGWKQYLARTGTPAPVVKAPPTPPAPPASSAPGKDGAKVEH
jgi:hypothetical protein